MSEATEKLGSGMSLRKLHQRLGEIIEQNESQGWDHRNDLPVVLRINRGGRRKDWFCPIERVGSSMLGLGREFKCIAAETWDKSGEKVYKI